MFELLEHLTMFGVPIDFFKNILTLNSSYSNNPVGSKSPNMKFESP